MTCAPQEERRTICAEGWKGSDLARRDVAPTSTGDETISEWGGGQGGRRSGREREKNSKSLSRRYYLSKGGERVGWRGVGTLLCKKNSKPGTALYLEVL